MRILLAVAVATLLLGCADRRPPETRPTRADGALVFRLGGLDEAARPIAYAVYDNPESFDARTSPLRSGFVTATGGEHELILDDLPAGEYAAAFYLDRNENGKLDRGALGVPSEPYGFSNDARRTFGPPGFEEARFRFVPGMPAMPVRLR